MSQQDSNPKTGQEKSSVSQQEWVETLSSYENKPTFNEIKESINQIAKNSPDKLTITLIDLYTKETHTKTVKINTVRKSTILCAEGQTRLFRMPDGTIGHFDTQGGTDRMPDIITKYDIE